MNRFVILLPLFAALLAGCGKKRYHVPTAAMAPTIPAGTHVVIDHNAYRRSDPIRWEIVSFHPPQPTLLADRPNPPPPPTWVMRVAGLPGETVTFGGKEIFIGGQALSPPPFLEGVFYAGLESLDAAPPKPRNEITLAEDEYFVLGDNTRNANDSRFWGPVSRDRITGRLPEP